MPKRDVSKGPRALLWRHVAALMVVLACVLEAACGGRILVFVDADGGDFFDAGETDDARDGSNAVDASAGDVDAGQPCILDASDDTALCTPPPDDVLYASPSVIDVPAGSVGTATFIASGPWASDPTLYMHFEGDTLMVLNEPYVSTYGTPQSIYFDVPSWQAGQQGVITVSGHLGNIRQTAQVTVNVIACVPMTTAEACAGRECGLTLGGCGGEVSCGTCSGATPYCYLEKCIAYPPHTCFPGSGFDPSTGQCEQCPAGGCPYCGLHGICTNAGTSCFCFNQLGE